MKPEKQQSSERVQMMGVAAQVVHLMFHRDVASRPGPHHHEGDLPLDPRDLNSDELAAYKAALRFLTKEFNLGVASAKVDAEDTPEDPTGGDKSREPVKPA